jgi:hypothetical protein
MDGAREGCGWEASFWLRGEGGACGAADSDLGWDLEFWRGAWLRARREPRVTWAA